MKALSGREFALVAVTMAAVFGVVGFLICLSPIRTMQDNKKKFVEQEKKLEGFRQVIDSREDWEQRKEKLLGSLKRYKADESVVSAVQEQVRKLAEAQGLVIEKSTPRPDETRIGELSEIEMNCDWSGSLEALVKFLYDVQNRGAMLDIRSLFVKPKSVQGQQGGDLSGSFKVYYAFLREQAPDTGATNAPPERAK